MPTPTQGGACGGGWATHEGRAAHGREGSAWGPPLPLTSGAMLSQCRAMRLRSSTAASCLSCGSGCSCSRDSSSGTMWGREERWRSDSSARLRTCGVEDEEDDGADCVCIGGERCWRLVTARELRVSQTIFRRTVLSMSRHARSSVSSDSIGVWLQMCACG